MSEQKLGRASSRTVLTFGLVKAPVALYKTDGKDADLPEFETAGPHGGALRLKEVPVEARPEEVPVGDPLAPIETETLDPVMSAIEAEAVPDAYVNFGTEEVTVPATTRSILVEEGHGDAEVLPEDRRKGLRLEDGFVDLTDQLRSIENRTKLEEMRVVSFIRVEQVPRDRILGSYWIAPEEGAGRALRLLFEAMRFQRRVAVVKWTKRTRQSLGVVVPHRSGALQVLQVNWAEAYLQPDAKVLSIQQAAVREEEVRAAAELVRAMSDSKASLDEQEDDAVRLRRELVAEVEAGKRPDPMPSRPVPADPDLDLKRLLAASVEHVERLV